MTATATYEDVKLHRNWHRGQSGDIGKAIVAFMLERSNIVVPLGKKVPVPEAKPLEFWTYMAGGQTNPAIYEVVFATTPMGYEPGHALLASEPNTNGNYRRYYVAEWNHGYAKLLDNEVIVKNPRHTPSPMEIITMIKDSPKLTW